MQVDLFNETGDQVASGVSGSNVDSYIQQFNGPTGTYYVKISGTATDYSLAVTRGADFDLEPNNGVGGQTQDISGVTGVLGYVGGNDDVYSFDVVAGEELVFHGSVPGAGPLLFSNNLQLQLQLIDAVGNVVATSGDSIQHTALLSGTYQLRVSASAGAGEYYVHRDVTSTEISGAFVRHVGYAGEGTDIDTGKVLVKETSVPQTLSYDNLINTSFGLNGLVFDIDGLPGPLSAADFEFRVSPTNAFNQGSNPPENWELAPAPSSVSVVSGSPSRVLVTWPNNAIQNQWLRIEVLSNGNTGLQTPEVYYLGHLLGETTGASDGLFTVGFADITSVRDAVGQTVDASSIYDINKDGLVAFADIVLTRSSIGSQLTAITVGGPKGALLGSGGHGNNGISQFAKSSGAFLVTPSLEAIIKPQPSTISSYGDLSDREIAIRDDHFERLLAEPTGSTTSPIIDAMIERSSLKLSVELPSESESELVAPLPTQRAEAADLVIQLLDSEGVLQS